MISEQVGSLEVCWADQEEVAGVLVAAAVVVASVVLEAVVLEAVVQAAVGSDCRLSQNIWE